MPERLIWVGSGWAMVRTERALADASGVYHYLSAAPARRVFSSDVRFRSGATTTIWQCTS